MAIERKEIPITVIVPVYNVQNYLREALCSIAQQTWQDFECILVDDGSTDNSGIICEKYATQDQRFRVIHKTNAGLSGARNTGIIEAGGNYIAFVDSDDIIASDMLEKLYNRAQKDDLDVVCGNVERFDSKTGKLSTIPPLQAFCRETETVKWNTLEGSYFLQALFNISACNKLFKRSLICSFQFPAGEKFEDVIFWSQVFFAADRIGCINDSVYLYRINRPGSICHIGNFAEYPCAWRVQFQALREHGIWEREKGNFTARIVLKFIQAFNRTATPNQKLLWERTRKLFVDFDTWEYASDFSFFVNGVVKIFFFITKSTPFSLFRILMFPVSIVSHPYIHTVIRQILVRGK